MAAEDAFLEEEPAPMVQWYEGRPLALPAAVATGSIVAAFTLGALLAVAALAMMGRIRE